MIWGTRPCSESIKNLAPRSTFRYAMNKDFQSIKSILRELRTGYISGCQQDAIDPTAPITERDIVAEIYCRLKIFCKSGGLYVHCEIKPAADDTMKPDQLKGLPKIDVGILADMNGRSWFSSAMKLQDKYKKGQIEARFSSVPVEFFHTSIEVKIQSNFRDAKKDIDTLTLLHEANKSCNCFFVLLNARGQRPDHVKIQRYADEKGICMFGYTCR